MKTIKKMAEYNAAISRIVQILKTETIIEGSLSQVEIPYGIRTHLTFKENGKTRTVYVPVDKVEEMKKFVANWKEVKMLLKEASTLALENFTEMIRDEKNQRKMGRSKKA